MKKIFYSPYVLLPRNSEGSQFPGALIRLEDDNGFSGYSDLHPKTNWGFLSLEEILQKEPEEWIGSSPANSKSSPEDKTKELLRLSLQSAEVDLNFRREHFSVWNPQSQNGIENNYLLNSSFDSESIDQALRNGFRVFKLKLGKNWKDKVSQIRVLHQRHPQIRWRLDFNSQLDETEAHEFVKSWSCEKPELQQSLDYVEDLTLYRGETWKLWNEKIPLAFDQPGKMWHPEELDPQSFRNFIFKPALQDGEIWVPWARAQSKKITVTSWMDHPVGVAHALRSALQISDRGISLCCSGLRTSFLFEENQFTRRLENETPFLEFPPGEGIGFNSELETLPWTLWK